MPDLEYFVVAESHAVDRDTNSISIFNVYNERKFDTFPVKIPRLLIISCWIASPEEIHRKIDSQIGINIVVDGRKLGDTFKINFTCDTEFQHLILEYGEIELDKAGRIEVELLLDGEHKAKHLIAIKSVDA